MGLDYFKAEEVLFVGIPRSVKGRRHHDHVVIIERRLRSGLATSSSYLITNPNNRTGGKYLSELTNKSELLAKSKIKLLFEPFATPELPAQSKVRSV